MEMKYLLRTLFWYFAGWLYIVASIPLYLAVKILGLLKLQAAHDYLTDWFAHLSGKCLLKLSGSKAIVSGTENIPGQGPVVFVPNHQGHMDDTMILGYIRKPKAFVSIVEVKKYFLIYMWMIEMKCVFMDRNNIKQSVECINKAADIVRSGQSMVIFPEGKMSGSDEIGEFKRGSLKLATKAGVPIIPVTISGTHRVMTRTGRHVRPATVYMAVGKPIETSGLSRDEEHALPERVRSIIAETMMELHRIQGI